MMFRTGSVDEVSGKTGLAHMFEHMMFKGTPTLGTRDYAAERPLLERIDELHRAIDAEKAKGLKGDQALIDNNFQEIQNLERKEAQLLVENELWDLYETEGASELNAATSRDFTQYVVDLPSNKIELWAILDSDRLKNPVFRQFYQERDVVAEERRMRVDTNPVGKLLEIFLAEAYTAHPYRFPTLGWPSDLSHLNVGDLEDFYHRCYTPDRLTIAIVGDVDAAKTIDMVDRYFGTWQAAPSPVTFKTEEPVQDGLRRISVRTPAQPYVLIGFPVATYPDPDYPVDFAIAQLLGEGTTSRLYQALVQRRQLASAIEASSDEPGERYNSLLIISAVPRAPHNAEEVERAVWQELDNLKKKPIEDWELQKVRAGVDIELLQTMQTNSGMADTLVYNQTVFGDWKHILEFQKKVETITAQDIQRVANKIFKESKENVGMLVTTSEQREKGEGGK
jgi:predicted Zn-dependent peptidase